VVTASDRTEYSTKRFVSNSAWTDEGEGVAVREMELPAIERHGPIKA
jgi:hypothetical protein